MRNRCFVGSPCLQASASRAARTFGRVVRFGLALAIAGSAALGIAAAADPAPPTNRPNIVLFVADDLGKELGCYGNTAIKTPRIDAFAKEGVRFDRAFATTASCSASRSVILTGLFNHANAHYGHEHSYHHFSAHDWVRSLPVVLGQSGYRTIHVGKFHVAPEKRFHFEVGLKNDTRNPVQMAEACRETLASSDPRPFFLYFCVSDPHRSNETNDDSPEKPNRFGNRTGGYPNVETVSYGPDQVVVPPFLPDTPACRAELAEYYQSVSRLDQGFGRLVDLLKEKNLYENTLVVFTSDHGMAFPGAKTTVYEPGLQVPFVVRKPGLEKPGSATQAMVSFVDLTPTLLEAAGALDPATGNLRAELASLPLDAEAAAPKKADAEGKKPAAAKTKKPAPYRFHGRSFLEVLDQPEKSAGRDVVFASHTFHEVTMYYPMRVVRERKYKLIWNVAHPLPFPFASDLWEAPTWQERLKEGKGALYGKRTVGAYLQRPAFELYDLEADPHESRNLAGDPASQETLRRLQGELKAFQTRTSDPWVLKWDYE